MSLFKRQPKQPKYIPEAFVRGLRMYGEALTVRPTQMDTATTLMADLDILDFARKDSDTFVDMLASHIRGPNAGPYCLGAAELVVLERLDVSTASWNQILAVAASHLRDLRIPYQQVKPYMRAWWEQDHGPGDW